jgi:hypothetical protein
VAEAKAEIARSHGTDVAQQQLYKLAVREDGGTVREDDAEPELLEDKEMELGAGEIVAMAVKELSVLWRTCPEDSVSLSEDGTMVTLSDDSSNATAVVTSGIELRHGRHFWEVEAMKGGFYVGVSRPNLDPSLDYAVGVCTEGWFIHFTTGGLYGNGKQSDDEAARFVSGDRIGVLLDLNNGSLLFFMNGVQYGSGYPAGSVRGPVVHALQFYYSGLSSSVRLVQDASWPAGYG